MSKNIAVCCDGTGNEIETRSTNVLKLFRCLEKDAGQLVFYDPGVGTISSSNGWDGALQAAQSFFGLATGWGIDDRVLRAYDFIVRTYEEDDRIYLIGFSRGAYTVRIVAALIHSIGLLRPQQAYLASYGLRLYRQMTAREGQQPDFRRLGHFKRFAGGRTVLIDFVGVWDTVSSILEPRVGTWLLPGMRTLPFTRCNEKVKVFRQAMAIDEPRRFFRLNRWKEPQEHFTGLVNGVATMAAQDIRQLWFAGDHSDIGGGHPEAQAGLAKFPLIWMCGQAEDFGLRIDKAMFAHLALGQPKPGNLPQHMYAKPDPDALLHTRIAWYYHIFEWLPKNARFKEWLTRRVLLGHYIPRYEPGVISDDGLIHASVQQRRGNPANGYDPVNVPGAPVFVPK